MQKVSFKVVPPRPGSVPLTQPGFVLEQDYWNDFSFQTQYHLSYYARTTNGAAFESTLIGAVKILRQGQTKADGLQISADFDRLTDQFCSVGQSLDYYERLRELGDIGIAAMDALRDVIAMPELVEKFRAEAGWAISLFRDQNDIGEKFRLLAAGLVRGNYAKAPVDQQSLTFKVTGWGASVVIDTTNGEPWTWNSINSRLPERVNVIVGRNGSGKSTLLARLARVAFGSPSDRVSPPLSGLGTLEPDGIGFPRVITVAFSPFDSFILPGSDNKNRSQIAKDMQRGIGRFSFIGLRDLIAEFDELGEGPPLPPVGASNREPGDRVGQTRLKSIAQLTDEFLSYWQKVIEKKREALLQAAINKLERGMLPDEWATAAQTGSTDRFREQFLRSSTGHKITLLVVFGLVASLEFNSLVLVDEPETHLHPPLLSAMMHSLRHILEAYQSSAVVATHSPVVVQESMARHVHVVRREGELTMVSPVSTETFGESIGLITSQIFGMESNATDFHEILDNLVRKYGDIQKIEALFQDGVMSHQARAYVLSRLVDRSQG